MPSSYEEALKRFKTQVDFEKVRQATLNEFRNEVQDWSGLKRRTSANRLANVFIELIREERERRERKVIPERVPIEKIIPTVKPRKEWTKREMAILWAQIRIGKGYGKRSAVRLGRTLKSVYMKAWRLQKRKSK